MTVAMLVVNHVEVSARSSSDLGISSAHSEGTGSFKSVQTPTRLGADAAQEAAIEACRRASRTSCCHRSSGALTVLDFVSWADLTLLERSLCHRLCLRGRLCCHCGRQRVLLLRFSPNGQSLTPSVRLFCCYCCWRN